MALCLFLRQRLTMDVGKKNEEPERKREVRIDEEIKERREKGTKVYQLR